MDDISVCGDSITEADGSEAGVSVLVMPGSASTVEVIVECLDPTGVGDRLPLVNYPSDRGTASAPQVPELGDADLSKIRKLLNEYSRSLSRQWTIRDEQARDKRVAARLKKANKRKRPTGAETSREGATPLGGEIPPSGPVQPCDKIDAMKTWLREATLDTSAVATPPQVGSEEHTVTVRRNAVIDRILLHVSREVVRFGERHQKDYNRYLGGTTKDWADLAQDASSLVWLWIRHAALSDRDLALLDRESATFDPGRFGVLVDAAAAVSACGLPAGRIWRTRLKPDIPERRDNRLWWSEDQQKVIESLLRRIRRAAPDQESFDLLWHSLAYDRTDGEIADDSNKFAIENNKEIASQHGKSLSMEWTEGKIKTTISELRQLIKSRLGTTIGTYWTAFSEGRVLDAGEAPPEGPELRWMGGVGAERRARLARAVVEDDHRPLIAAAESIRRPPRRLAVTPLSVDSAGGDSDDHRWAVAMLTCHLHLVLL